VTTVVRGVVSGSSEILGRNRLAAENKGLNLVF
jgi:hypothetical protein